MFEILMIRHGETDNNKYKKFTGSTDVGLNETGRKQALRLAEILKDETLDNIYSSDLKRCVETGKHIGANNVVYTENLREMNFGRWEGLTYDEIKERYPGEIETWRADWCTFTVPEGESFIDMSKRVLKEFEEIIKMKKDSDGKIAIISHSGCIRTILSHHIIGSVKESWKFRIDNAAVSRLCIENSFFYLKTLNEK